MDDSADVLQAEVLVVNELQDITGYRVQVYIILQSTHLLQRRLDLEVLVLYERSQANRLVFGNAQDFFGVGEALVALIAHEPENLILVLLGVNLLPAITVDILEGGQFVVVVQCFLEHHLHVCPLQLIRVLQSLKRHLVPQHFPMLELGLPLQTDLLVLTQNISHADKIKFIIKILRFQRA